uniref:Uncharacterized protein n=1 Tax=Phallusia mammillata TaxID=59560 RepID=A0A6F9DRZ0_9ASCI|nr:hypothetical protein cihA2F15 uncharacterized protein LOC494370 [Phallusia mammillata]
MNLTCHAFQSAGIIQLNCTSANPGCATSGLRCVEKTRPWLLAVAVLSSYLTVVVTLYEWSHRKRKQTAAVNRSYVLSVALTYVFTVSSVISIYRGSYEICLSHKIISMFLYSASTLLNYTLLWTRQRFLHKGHLMGSVTCLMNNYVSYCVIVGIYATFAALLTVFFGTVCLIVSDRACLIKYSQHSTNSFIKAAIITFLFTGVVFKFGLLALMAHPLHKSNREGCHPDPEIPRLLKRLFYSTAVCVTTSTTFGIMLFLDVYNIDCINWEVPGGFDLVASNTAIIFTFSDGCKRIFPVEVCLKSCGNKRTSATVIAPT